MTAGEGDMAARVHSVQAGRVAPLGPEGVPSAFVKTAMPDAVRVAEMGIEGDEQADLRVHGGRDKAVYCYPWEHYAAWVGDVPRHRDTLIPGAFGENLTTLGLDEGGVAIGDVFRIGTVEIQVTQPRQPCSKLGLRFADNSLGRIMMQTGRTGWYVRVLTPGVLRAGDGAARIRRTDPAWTISRFNDFILHRRTDRAVLRELAELEALASTWRDAARASLARE